MANNYKNHLRVILEAKPYRDILNGVTLSTNIKDGLLDVRNPCNGWPNVFKELEKEVIFLEKLKDRHLLMIIDFDYEFESRYKIFFSKVPSQYQNRVFILGVDNKESEQLKGLFSISDFEKIGKKLVEDCPTSDLSNWRNKHLECNLIEIERMKDSGVFDWLFNK